MWFRSITLGAGLLSLAAVNAQTVPVEDQPAVSSAIGGVDGEARFVPSDEAQLSEVSFDEGFEAYSGDVDPGAIPPHAVRLDTFDPPLEVEPEPRSGRSLGMGVASYYGARFAGRLTANGERFNPREMTAAHKTLPFGTRVRVTNPRNGKSVIVRINDRGPFIRGRTIDLSRGAAEEIGIVRAGHGRVAMEIVE